jgi:hypothetical protein
MTDNRAALIAGLRKQLATLQSDLRAKTTEPEIDRVLRSEWEDARAASRTAAAYASWREVQVTQSAAAWLLGTVFLRFCEDNELIPYPFLTGTGNRGTLARERQDDFFQQNPDANDRHWILSGLQEMSKHSAMARVLDPRHNPMGHMKISDGTASDLITFWRTQNTTGLVHDFTDPDWNTGFLGDLYQDLSEEERAAYALLQTPNFVTDFILDHTLDPAVEEFGLEGLRVIDPVCGSGNFILNVFERLIHRHHVPATASSWDEVNRTLASVHGVDKNPLAVMVTRFRLIIAAMRAGGARRLTDLPDLGIIVATGDSLIHGRGAPTPDDSRFSEETSHHLKCEDISEFPDANLLAARSYHVVVGNPPFITPKDKAESDVYRAVYSACAGSYALTVPFIVRFFGLAVRSNRSGSGYVGLLSSNSFTKREFGRRLIEQFFPTIDLSHVIDSAGAFIPGHGTPTIILLGRNQPPRTPAVKIIVGLHGEPEVPSYPDQGRVWRSILEKFTDSAAPDKWTQLVDVDREVLFSFPWALSSPTEAGILRQMESGIRLGSRVERIGYFASTGSDEVFTAPPGAFRRAGVEAEPLIPIITGSEVRDWTAHAETKGAFFTAATPQTDAKKYQRHMRRLWPFRTVLGQRRNYSGQSYFEDGRPWYEWHHVTETHQAHPWSIVFSWVSTHNHFAVLRERAAPLSSAPVIRLPSTATDMDLLQLAALLNSSLVCFWLKQYSNSKGQPRAYQTGTGEPWTIFYEFTSTRLRDLPLPLGRWSRDRWSISAEQLDKLAQQLSASEPRSVLQPGSTVTNSELDAAYVIWESTHTRLVALQEELDWEIYKRYGLLEEDDEISAPQGILPGIAIGERAFEIVLARRQAEGIVNTTWFTRNGITPITEIPHHWPQQYRRVVGRRVQLIEQRQDIGLIEQPQFKRRWLTEPWKEAERGALHNWLLDRCEQRDIWYEVDQHGNSQPRPLTVSELAALLAHDECFLAMASRYAPTARPPALVAQLTAEEHVPHLAALRYTDSGLRKRAQWERMWEAQREEDATGRHPEGLEPPRYSSADYLKAAYWRQRGKLDVPNERFISYPTARTDGEAVIGWTGWTYSDRAAALIRLIEDQERSDASPHDVIVPLLAGLRELVPWLRQWHKEPDALFRISGPAYEVQAYLDNKLAEYALQGSDLANWLPQPPKRGRPPKNRPL